MEGIIILQEEQLEQALFGVLTKFFSQRDEEQEATKVLESTRNLERSEVCDRWAVSKSTLNNWCNRGLIKPMKLGRRVLFPMSEILRAESEGLTKFRQA